MSEQQKAEQPEKPEQAEQTQSIEERLAQLESTNKRLLEQSKEWKSKYQSVKEDVEKKEQETLSQKEDWKKLLEKERESHGALKDRLSKLKLKTINKALEFEIAKAAPDAQDIDLLKQALPRDVIDAVEEDDDIKLVGVKEAVEKLKGEKPFLFKPKQIPGMAQGKPAVDASGGKKDLSKLTPAELASLLITRKV